MSDCRKCAKFEECAVDEDCGLFVDKPMTNADRIRTMTDEELARYMTPDNFKFPCPPNKNVILCEYDKIPCWICWVRWLKSPEVER